MSMETIVDRFRSGNYTPEDIRSVNSALASGNDEFLEHNIFQYIKRVTPLNEDMLIRYLQITKNPNVAAQIVSGLSFRNSGRLDFTEQVLRFAAGLEWDDQDIVRLTALFGLPRVTVPTARVKSVLRSAYRSSNPVVRDAALTSAQTYIGVEAKDTQWGRGSEDMTKKVPSALLEWLNADAN